MKQTTKKGFTIVELVIVIAVIAILAAVLIPTFTSVIKKANESAYLQEKTSQKIDDLAQKVENPSWLGWEDLETNIVTKISAAIAENGSETTLDSELIQQAVKAAVANYYAESGMGNSSLTEEQVQKIVENALKTNYGGVTEEQVKSVVETAIGKIPQASSLTAAQVQSIVDSALSRANVGGGLTSAQVSSIVAKAFADNKPDFSNLATTQNVTSATNTIVNSIIDKITQATADQLTDAQVKAILKTLIVSAGDTTWVSAETYAAQDEFELTTADEVVGLATLVNGGYDFEDKTVTLPATIDLTDVDFTPIGNTYDTQFLGTLSGADENAPTVVTGLTLTEQFNAVMNGFLIDCSSTGNMDKVGVGFVAYLGEGAVLENIVFEDVNINITDNRMDGISIGVAVGYLDGGTIRNVTVSGGTVKSVYRVGGLVGAAAKGTIDGCTVENVTIVSTGIGSIQPVDANSALGGRHHEASGLIGYTRNFAIKKPNFTVVTINNTTVTGCTITCCDGAHQAWTLAQPEYDTATINVTGTSTANAEVAVA